MAALESSGWCWRAQNYFLNDCDNFEPRASQCGLRMAKPVPGAL